MKKEPKLLSEKEGKEFGKEYNNGKILTTHYASISKAGEWYKKEEKEHVGKKLQY